jgi:hypothetical protein
MPKWIPCGAGFIEADVIRWKEGVWKKARRAGSRAVNIGERLVTAEVLHDKEGWVRLLIRAQGVLSEKTGRRVLEVLPKGAEIRRKRATIERGKPERLIWSDESARAMVSSRFLRE